MRSWTSPRARLFVHRNVANVVVHTDLNCLSARSSSRSTCFASTDVLVTRHYGCGGVLATLEIAARPHRQLVAPRRRCALLRAEALPHSPPTLRPIGLCELNVIEQARHVCENTVVQNAWQRGQPLSAARLDLRSPRRPVARSGILGRTARRRARHVPQGRALRADAALTQAGGAAASCSRCVAAR